MPTRTRQASTGQDQHAKWVRLTDGSRRGVPEFDGTAPRRDKDRHVGRTKGHIPQIDWVIEVGGDRRRIERLNGEGPTIETGCEHPAVCQEAVGIDGVELRSRAITRIA